MKTFSDLQKRVHETATLKGWHDTDELGEDGLPTARQMLAWSDLITDEIDEAALETRAEYVDDNGKPCGYLTEIVDARIRLMDMATACKIDLDSTAAINCRREYGPLKSLSAERNDWRRSVRKGIRAGVELGMLRYLLCIDRLFREQLNRTRPGVVPIEFVESELERVTLLKAEFNDRRSYRHGGKLA